MAKKASLGRLSAEVDARNTRFKRVMGETAAIARRDSRAISRSLRDVGLTARGMGKSVRTGLASFSGMALGAAGVAFGLKAMISEFANVSRGVREISTLMGGLTDRELEDMRKELQSLAAASGKAIDGLVKARYDIVSAGFSGAADSAMVLNQATQLAVAGVADVSVTADLLTTALNAWGLAAADVESVSDKLFETVRLGKTTITELAGTLGKAAAIAAPLGVTLDDVLGSVARLTAAGQSTEEAFTAIRAAIVEMAKPGAQLSKVFRNIGFASGRAAIDELGFARALEAIAKEAERLDVPLTDVLGNIRSMQAALPLTGDGADDLADSIADIGDGMGSTADASAIMMDDVDIQFDRFKEAIKGIGSDIASFIATPLSKVAGGIANLRGVDGGGPAKPLDPGQVKRDELSQSIDRQIEKVQGLRKSLEVLGDLPEGDLLVGLRKKRLEGQLEKATLRVAEMNDAFTESVFLLNVIDTVSEQAKLNKLLGLDEVDMGRIRELFDEVLERTGKQQDEEDKLEKSRKKFADEELKRQAAGLEPTKEEKAAVTERIANIRKFTQEFADLGKSRFDLERELLDAEVDLWRDAQISETEIQRRESEKRKQISIAEIQAKLDMAGQFLDSLGQITANLTEAENLKIDERIENQLSREQMLFEGQKRAITDANSENGRLTQAGRNRIEQVEERHRAKTDAIRQQGVEDRRKAGKKMKAIQIAQSVLNAGVAITDAFATQPFFPNGLAAGLLATGIMASEIAVIKAQKFAKGGAFGGQGIVPVPSLFDTGNGLGLAGEVGEEGILPLSRGPGGRLGVSMNGGGEAGKIINLSIIVNGPTDSEFVDRTIDRITDRAIENDTEIVIKRDFEETDSGLQFERVVG